MSARFVLDTNAAGRYYFNLKAANGEIIATSQSYGTKSSALNGIDSVRNNAPGAPTVDIT
ncbi:YegP family protein [Antrihabitans sp. YC2-6]|uniref:YegP family protein n=1 Tax=Antrihabitans sp. YC2-6 TaxID=2799498 RepID=UPI0018F7022D|nr:YegP family protein [Antrihabitans sp. YC2-6]MBJ8348274.1 DUF1508 domain-containing protein [Antrihabitans sp. YC2-6]